MSFSQRQFHGDRAFWLGPPGVSFGAKAPGSTRQNVHAVVKVSDSPAGQDLGVQREKTALPTVSLSQVDEAGVWIRRGVVPGRVRQRVRRGPKRSG